MLTSITPLGERGRGNRCAVTLTAYVLGCLLGGATTGVLLGALGSLLPALPVLAPRRASPASQALSPTCAAPGSAGGRSTRTG